MESALAPLLPSSPPAITAPARRLRTWPALLVLFRLSPLVGEVISGSTPPLLAIQPFALIFLPTLYGISAVLIHEMLVRRRLGWGNALLLGAAFGIFQEALIVQTWFNYIAPGSPTHSLGAYGVAWGTNWVWALNLTAYHAVVSITIPLIWARLLFPRRALLPWLGVKAAGALTVWMLALCGALASYVAFTQFAAAGYSGPPLVSYLAAAALLLVALLLGAFVRFPAPRARTAKPAPGLWRVRITCFALMTAYFLATIVLLPATHLPAPVTMAAGAALFAFGVWLVSRWSTRAGWGPRHWLAVVTGVVMYFALLWAPLVEFGLRLPARTGLTAFDIAVVVALLIWDRRLRRRALTVIAIAVPSPLLSA